MSYTPSVDDLSLVVAVTRHGSIGAAARELLIAQPSASARLSALERRLGTRLFERDTTGARPTDAGRAFADEAAHILSHLRLLPERVRAGGEAPLLRVATFPSLAAVLFPALDAVLADEASPVGVHQHVDHGDTLIDLVAEGSLDVAVIAIADQLPLPSQVTTTALGSDRLVLLSSAEAPSRGRRPFAGIVPYHCVDMSGAAIEAGISKLGGTPRRCATGEVAALTARASGQPALLAGTIAALCCREGERIGQAPVRRDFTFRLVTRAPVPALVRGIAPRLAHRMGLRSPDRAAREVA